MSVRVVTSRIEIIVRIRRRQTIGLTIEDFLPTAWYVSGSRRKRRGSPYLRILINEEGGGVGQANILTYRR
jgi:hypothetical protein